MEIDLRAKDPQVLQFMVGVVEDYLVTKEVLQLFDGTCCESWFGV